MHFIRFWKPYFSAIIVVGLFFILWDIYFAYQNVWGFNNQYLVGFYLFKLPVEEWLFFLLIPYSSNFIHYSLEYFFPKLMLSEKVSSIVTVLLLIVAFTITAVSYTHLDVYKRQERYSTSFSKASKLFKPEIRQHIYNIYAFVRLADEIVDTFHDYDQEKLLNEFERNYSEALYNGISLNPVLYSFCKTQKEKNIPQDLVDAFLRSMRMDLGEIKDMSDAKFSEYIYGSSEVVGLMCLKVFVNGNQDEYEKLKPYAQSLGCLLYTSRCV